MTEAFLRSLEVEVFKDFPKASNSYRDLWGVLQNRNYPLKTIRSFMTSFPSIEDSSLDQAKIPYVVIRDVAHLPRRQFEKIIADYRKLNRAHEENQRGDLSVAHWREVFEAQSGLGSFWSRFPEGRKRKEAAKVLVTVLPLAVAAKFIQQEEFLPNALQGRLVDFLAVPTFASVGRMCSMRDKLSGDVFLGLFTAGLIELAQRAGILPGTFDPGDFAAYAAGALAYRFLFRSKYREF